jgi:putative oxidoreductase
MTIVRRIARPLLAASFVSIGVDALRNPGPVAADIEPLVKKARDAFGISADPDPKTVVRVNGALLIGAGILLATGRLPRVAGLVLALGLAPTTTSQAAFWREGDPALRAERRAQFLKNLSLAGAALLAAADTAGKPGLGWRGRHAAKVTKHAARAAAKDARLQARITKAQAKAGLERTARKATSAFPG